MKTSGLVEKCPIMQTPGPHAVKCSQSHQVHCLDRNEDFDICQIVCFQQKQNLMCLQLIIKIVDELLRHELIVVNNYPIELFCYKYYSY